MSDWWRRTDSGIELRLRLTPKASADRIEGVERRDDGKKYLAARVRAVPEDGKANEALIALIAKHFRTAKSRVKIVGGQTSRIKAIAVAGLDAPPDYQRSRE